MSRVIKFRAWDTYRNQMWSGEGMGSDEMTLNPDGRGFVNVSGASPRYSDYMRHLIPMQFTGLMDRNGREIYEGDILNVWDWGRPPQALLTVSVLEWDLDEKGWGLNPDPTDGNRYDLFRNVEVIGNIYEQPELVKQ